MRHTRFTRQKDEPKNLKRSYRFTGHGQRVLREQLKPLQIPAINCKVKTDILISFGQGKWPTHTHLAQANSPFPCIIVSKHPRIELI
jgi:hypothetical protein